MLKEKLIKNNKQIHICCNLSSSSRINTIFLICIFLLVERKTVDSILQQQTNKVYPSKYAKPKPRPIPDFSHPLTIFQNIYPPLEDYEDALGSPFLLPLTDALSGFIKSYQLNWFDPYSFIDEHYFFYLNPENGFMTWIVPKRILVLSAPGIGDSPHLFDMLPLFRKWKIKTIFNFVNEGRGFEDLVRVGIEKITFDVSQDSFPSLDDLLTFCDICDRGAPAAICSLTGLGRAPMFVALWLVRSFGFSSKEAIAWVRIVRQGSIYGIQQDFVTRMERSLSSKNPKN